MLQITTLPSGFRVATYKINRDGASIAATIGAGARYESIAESGIGHFLEHLTFTGTKSYPTERVLKDSVENLGGFINASTGPELTTFHVHILQDHLDQALKTMAEQIQDSLLKPKDIEQQKEIVDHEINRMKNDPERYVSYLKFDSLFPNQTFGVLSDYDQANLPTIDREKVLEYLSHHYTAKNTVITLAGNLDHEIWVDKVSKAFSKLPTLTAKSMNTVTKGSGRNFKGIIRESKQLNLVLAYHGPAINSSEFYAGTLLELILYKRHYNKLRIEMGLTYSPDADYSAYINAGVISLKASFPLGKAKIATKAMFEVLDDIKNRPPSTEELQSSLEMRRSSLTFRKENVLSLAESYSRRISLGLKSILLEDEIKELEKVDSKQIQQLAKKYITSDYHMVAIGSEEDIKELEKLYGQNILGARPHSQS